MERISDPNLRAYIVWLPVLPSGAHEAAAQRETKRIRDNRAVQFFDAEARVGKVYSSILHLPSGLPAWDVYLVFGPEVHWEGSPPAPTYWMHQLGRAGPPELRLDGERLERVVRSLLPKGIVESGGRSESAVGAEPRLAQTFRGSESVVLHSKVLVDGISGPEGRQRIARGVSRGTWSWVNRLPAPEGRQTMAHTFADLLTHFQEFIALLKAHGFASAERHIWE